MPIVKLPNGTKLNFPEGMSEDDMRAAIVANFPQFAPEGGPAPAENAAPLDDGSAMRDALIPVRTPDLSAGQDNGVMDDGKEFDPNAVPASLHPLSQSKWAEVMQQERTAPLSPRLRSIPAGDLIARAQLEAANRIHPGNEQFQSTVQAARGLAERSGETLPLAPLPEGVATIGAVRGQEASIGSVARGLAGSLSTGASMAREGVRMQLADAFGSDAVLEDAKRNYGQSALEADVNRPAFESDTARGIYGGAESTLRMIPGLAASIATRSSAPALATMGLQTEADAYAKYRTRGATGGEALLGGVAEGATEVATELLPMGFLVQKFGKVGAGQFLSGLIAREVPSEQVATVVQDAVDTAIANPNKSWGEYLQERPGAAYQSLVATLTQSAIMGGASGLSSLATRQQADRAPNQDASDPVAEPAAEARTEPVIPTEPPPLPAAERRPSIDDIGRATSIDEAIAAAQAVVSAPRAPAQPAAPVEPVTQAAPVTSPYPNAADIEALEAQALASIPTEALSEGVANALPGTDDGRGRSAGPAAGVGPALGAGIAPAGDMRGSGVPDAGIATGVGAGGNEADAGPSLAADNEPALSERQKAQQIIPEIIPAQPSKLEQGRARNERLEAEVQRARASLAARKAAKAAPQPVAIDDELLETAMEETKGAGSLIKYDILEDQQGVIPGKPTEVNRKLKRGDYTLEDIANGWGKTRELLRARHGDTVRLYRAEAPQDKWHPDTQVVYMGDEKLASRFKREGRELKSFDVPVDDVLAMNVQKNGYYEFIVKRQGEPMTSSATSKPAAEVPAQQGYQLPEDVNQEWRGSQRDDFKPNPRQQLLMDAVAAELDAGVFYNSDLYDKVTARLGIAPDVLSRNETGVERGDVGYDIYHAREAVEAKRGHAKAKTTREAMGLKVGDELGTLIFSTDFKVNTNATVEAVEDGGQTIKIKGKRGRYTVQITTNPTSIGHAMDRAKEKGKRKEGYDEFVAARAPKAEPASATPEKESEPQANTQTPLQQEVSRVKAKSTKAQRAKSVEAEKAKLESRRKKDQDDKEVRARQDASAENFQLGQSAEDSLSGQQGLELSDISRDSNTLTIEVDGKRRPITNSKGQKVAADFKGQMNFWKWFQDSAVVDEKGAPLVAYHGSATTTIEEFLPHGSGKDSVQAVLAHFRKAKDANERYGYMNFRGGSFFSPIPEYAGNYTGQDGGVMYPVYIKAENPIYFDMVTKEVTGVDAGKTPDALIMVIDGEIQEIAVIDPTQVKSAVGNTGTFNPDSANITHDVSGLMKDSAFARMEEPKRVATLAKLQAAQKKRAAGKVTDEQYRAEIAHIIDLLKERNDTKAAPKDLERGPDWVKERLMRAKRTEELEPDVVDFALWALDKNPQLATGLAISLRTSNNGASGTYKSVERLMTLFKGNTNPGTAVHEILHHSERMMPQQVQEGIASEWFRAYMAAWDKANPKQRAALEDMMSMDRNKAAFDRTLKAFADGTLSYAEHYHLSNASEYWAVKATSIMARRYHSSSWIAKAKTWLAEMVQKVRGLLGMESDAAILKALDGIIKGDGKFQSPNMLTQLEIQMDIDSDGKPSITPVSGNMTMQWYEGSENMLNADLPNGWTAVIYHDEEGAQLSLFDGEAIDMIEPMEFDTIEQAKAAMPTILTRFRKEFGSSMTEWKGAANDGDSILRDIPRWLKSMPKETQEAANKAGIWAPQLPLKQRLVNLRDKAMAEFTQGVFDQFHPLMGLNYKSYILARMTRSADAPLETILLYGKPFMNDAGAIDVNLEKGGFVGVLQELQGEHDRFFAWVAGNRAARLKKEGRENLFTDDDITALKDLNNGTMPDGSNRKLQYEKSLIKLNQYSRAVMDIAEKAGIIDGDSRDAWEHDFYVPFYRAAEKDGKVKAPRNAGGLVQQYAFKKLKGGTDNLNDLLHNTLRNWSHLIAASLNNQAAASAIKAAHAMGIAEPVQASQKESVFFLEKGQQQHFVIHDPLILDAVTSLEWAGWKHPTMKALQKAKQYLTLGVTVSPTFKIRNLMRDQIAAVAQNPVSANIARNLVEGWQGTSKKSDVYAKMLTGGGLMRFGTFLEGDRAEHVKRLIDDGVDSAQILTTPARIKNVLSAAWDGWQEIGDRSENITRAAIYKQRHQQILDMGFSEDEAHLIASFAARDSMDFSLQGKWVSIRLLAQMVPFFNARLQGLYKLGREGVAPSARMIAPRLFGQVTTSDKRKAQRFGAVVLAVSLASVALMLAQDDDEDYQALEDWKRDAYWCFKVGDTMYFIPKPFEVGAIGTLAERGVEAMMDGMDKDSRKRFGERMGSMLMNTFAMNPTPQLLKPMIDLYANRDSFTGRQIEGVDLERLSKAERIGPRTSTTAQALAEPASAVGLSPVQIDHLVRAYFGWLGTHAVMTADFAVRPLMGLPEQPTRRFPDDYMVLGDFATGLPSSQSRYVTMFYEQAKEVQQAMADIRHYQALGLKDKVAELRAEHGDLSEIEPIYTAAQRQLGDINREIKLTMYRKLSPDEKRERIDALTVKRNELAERVEMLRKKREAKREEVEG